MPPAPPTIHEVDFCAQVASAVNGLVGQNPIQYPFCEARVEGFGISGMRRRVTHLGGQLDAGEGDGMFEVRVTIPTDTA